MLKNYFTKVSVFILCVSCLGTNVFAGVTTDSSETKNSEQQNQNSKVATQELSFVNQYLRDLKARSALKPSEFGYNGSTKLGLFKNEINVTGVVRFLTIYRDMGNGYSDMAVGKRNISFQDQPLASVGTAIGGGYPMLELNLSSKFSKNTDFNVGYSFSHSITGNENGDNTRMLTNMQNLRVGGNFYTALGKFGFQAGSILPVKLSKFCMGQPAFRDDYFDRLPWDWYRNTFLRYEEYYSLKLNMGGQNEGRALFSGLTMNGTIIPLGLNFTALYGRSSQTAPYATQTGAFFPSILYGGRLEKSLFTKDVNGKYAFNYYRREADLDNASGISDNNQMITLDADMQFKGYKLVGELAYSTIENTIVSPLVDIPQSRSGIGAQFRSELTRKVFPIHLTTDIYYIEKNVVSFDGSILNTNSNFRTSGVATEAKYDGNLLNNVVQEIGQYANNRMGISLKTDFKIEKLTLDLGLMISQELENINDSTITIQHRVNAFTRSRFHPNFMEGGNYNRIRSVFRRTYENIAITQGNAGNKKSFNAAEAMLMYKTKILGREIVMMTYHTYSAALSHINIAENFTNDAYTRQYYGDATIAWKLFKKACVVGNVGYERLLGGKNTIKDKISGGTVDQTGKSFGVGIDYDFLSTAGLHLRHKWFTHEDANFSLDKFDGHETYLELKFFF